MPLELVFVHGWGFDAHLWDALAAQLKQFNQLRVDLGFYGNRSPFPQGDGKILVGHSLGLVHGIGQKQNWAGWIAINGFLRFVETQSKPGCTSTAALRDMRMRLQADPGQTLKNFYDYIGATPPTAMPNAERLREGLDELRDVDIENDLKMLDVSGLVLAGGRDVLVPIKTSEALGRMAKNGGLKLKEEGGHVLPQTAPDWCAKMIADFLSACFDRA